MKIDFHCHTSFSYDGYSSYNGLAKAAKIKGIDVIFITEHDKINSQKDMIFSIGNTSFIKGCEYTTQNGAHIIGLFVDKELTKKNNTYEDIFRHIKKNNGLISVPHPFKPGSGLLSIERDSFEDLNLEDVDLIELYNGGYKESKYERDLIIELAKKNNIKIIGASDAHKEIHLGYYVTGYKAKKETIKDIIKNYQGEVLHDSSFKSVPRKITKIQKNSLFVFFRNFLKYEHRISIKRFLYFFKNKKIRSPIYVLKYSNDQAS